MIQPFAAFVVAQETSPSRSILDTLPTDPASLFTIVLAVAVTVLVVVAGRKSGKKGPGPDGAAS